MSFEPDSLGRLLLRRAAAQPDDEGLVFPGTRLTFRQLERRAMELARALVGIGIEPGDRVALLMPNCVDMVRAIFAGSLVGAVLVPINARYKRRELGHVIGHSGAVVVLTTDVVAEHVDFLELLLDSLPELSYSPGGELAAPSAPALRHIVVFGEPRHSSIRDSRWLEDMAAGITADEVLGRQDAIEVGDDATSETVNCSATDQVCSMLVLQAGDEPVNPFQLFDSTLTIEDFQCIDKTNCADFGLEEDVPFCNFPDSPAYQESEEEGILLRCSQKGDVAEFKCEDCEDGESACSKPGWACFTQPANEDEGWPEQGFCDESQENACANGDIFPQCVTDQDGNPAISVCSWNPVTNEVEIETPETTCAEGEICVGYEWTDEEPTCDNDGDCADPNMEDGFWHKPIAPSCQVAETCPAGGEQEFYCNDPDHPGHDPNYDPSQIMWCSVKLESNTVHYKSNPDDAPCSEVASDAWWGLPGVCWNNPEDGQVSCQTDNSGQCDAVDQDGIKHFIPECAHYPDPNDEWAPLLVGVTTCTYDPVTNVSVVDWEPEPCAAGLECVNGQCMAPTGECNPACEAGFICDAGACRACVGDECGQSDCTVTGCAAGQVCDATSKTCVPASTAGACASCTTADDCPAGGWTCVPLSTGQACLPPCTTSDDCTTGWTCFNGACAPGGFSCAGCNVDGCTSANDVCDTNTGNCTSPQSQCGACTYDWECGDGNACHSFGPNLSVCVPRCSGGAACPGGANCITDDTSGYKVCEPKGTTCCFDENPANCPDTNACTPACGGGTPHCKLGVCVACLEDAHCPQGQTCNTNNGTCSGGGPQCGGGTPHWNEAKGTCVQCLNDTHCGGSVCNPQTNTCENDICGTCADPYPACAEVNGEFYCVQCTDDSYCGQGGTCQIDTYSCQGGTVNNPDPCSSDADCDAGVSGFNLACDLDSGFCYDKDGGCDDVTAFCMNGNDCVDFFELLGMAGGGGLPGGLPGGGGATLPGSCECTPKGGAIPGLPSESDDCPPGVLCGNFLDLLGGLGGGGGGGGKNVCGGGLPGGLPFP